ncbi:MAG: alpha/beta hydrolase family protein [Pirellulaceae bacterium]
MTRKLAPVVAGCLVAMFSASIRSAEPGLDTSRGDQMIAAYFQAETDKLAERCLAQEKTLEEWKAHRQRYHQQLLEMLGLDPFPPRTDLQATITGTVDHEEFRVEKLHFQSRPGLYVSGNLYVPKKVEGRLPAILYVCGHGNNKKDGVSYGSKSVYQHHGGWFARHGYVCLTIDTLQLGEIEGIHHGTYRYGMWWWLNRGYTPAGVEAWNCIRALDYLQSRPEVDPQRLGVTGRSGGGAYSWWIAAIDERIRCAVPVAGITDLTNHVVDGCVEGHCDCMFMVNTHRWDYATVAALVAPRPLLISNTDSDGIFPLDGVVRLFEKVRGIYRLHGAADQVALNITAGPHKDTQELQVHAFRWFNHHLKQDDALIEKAAVKFFQPEELKVFGELPRDEQNTRIHESFVASAPTPAIPRSAADWSALQENWLATLKEKVFAGWPTEQESLGVGLVSTRELHGLVVREYAFTSQVPFRLPLVVVQSQNVKAPELTVLNVLDETEYADFAETVLSEEKSDAATDLARMLSSQKWAMAYVAPRGIGPTAWDATERKQIQHQRRFYLLGQSLDSMRVWDTRRAIQAVRSVDDLKASPLWLQSHRAMAGNVLYASLFEPDIVRLDLYELPASHQAGPYYLNVSRFLDTPQALALAAARARVVLYKTDASAWQWPRDVAAQLKWPEKQLQFRQPLAKQ